MTHKHRFALPFSNDLVLLIQISIARNLWRAPIHHLHSLTLTLAAIALSTSAFAGEVALISLLQLSGLPNSSFFYTTEVGGSRYDIMKAYHTIYIYTDH